VTNAFVSRGMRRSLAIVLGASALGASRAAAQGSLSSQGFGYPTGEISTRAMGTGGSNGEFDPASALNPASIGSWGASPINSAIRQWWGRTALSVQYDPEFRSVSNGSASQTAMLPRFPLISLAIPVKQKLQLGISAATLLDRTFSTTLSAIGSIGGETVLGSQSIESRGSIEDVRFAGAWNVARGLTVGLGAHVLTGQNRLVSSRTFADTSEFGDVSDTTQVDFRGRAISGGVELRPIPGFSIAGSYRHGGWMRAQRDDTTLTHATAPDRYGVGVRVDRVPGAAFTASYGFTKWSNLEGLAVSSLHIADAPEFALGAEAVGPHVGSTQVLFRVGGRRRTLPFGLSGADVRESSIAGGFSAPFNGGRAVLDFTAQHAQRSPIGGSVNDVKESAWTMSFGLTMRP
jgi:hypothetical protein